jgi:hypothetical protein
MPKRRVSIKGLRPELSERGIWQAVGTIAGNETAPPKVCNHQRQGRFRFRWMSV